MSEFTIRKARSGDETLILSLLRELADYEKLLDRFHITENVIRRDYLGAQPVCNCELAFADGAPVGVMTWYWTYASFAAKRAVYLEDLYVRQSTRGRGHGKALLAHLAKIAVEADAARIDWQVLPWNAPSIAFYERIGAERLTDWLVYSLSGEALKAMGA